MVNEQGNGIANHLKSINLKIFPSFEMEDDFVVFQERLENVFEVLRIEEDQKCGIFIAILGPKIYKILKNLCNPDFTSSA